jgi:hypothetical protein
VTKAVVRWLIEWDSDAYAIMRNGRSFMYGLPDIPSCVAAIKRSHRYTKGDVVTAFDKQGASVTVRL